MSSKTKKKQRVSTFFSFLCKKVPNARNNGSHTSLDFILIDFHRRTLAQQGRFLTYNSRILPYPQTTIVSLLNVAICFLFHSFTCDPIACGIVLAFSKEDSLTHLYNRNIFNRNACLRIRILMATSKFIYNKCRFTHIFLVSYINNFLRSNIFL